MDTENTENTEQTEDPYSEEDLHADMHASIEFLASEIHEKYPDVIELVSLSPEEILIKYPTEVDIHALEERVLQYESEYLEDIRDAVKVLIYTGHMNDLVDGLVEIRSPYQLRPHTHQTPIAFIDMVSITSSRAPGAHVDIEPGAQQKIVITVHLRTHHNISKEILVNMDKPSIQTVGLGRNGGIVFQFDDRARLQNAHYIPQLGWHAIAIELFLKGKYNDVFVPVYPTNTEDNTTVKVWKINYPAYIKKDTKYLVTEPTDTGTEIKPVENIEQHSHEH